MPVYTPLGENLRYRFVSMETALGTIVPDGQPWKLVCNGEVIASGTGDGTAPNPVLQGGYVPFACMDDGGYGYSIDSGAALITEDSDGLLVAMTASTSWGITLTAIAPTTGAHFLLQALHLWSTISAPVAPAAGDNIYIRSETDATNYSEAALHYDGAAWEVRSRRLVGGASTDSETNLVASSINGTRIWGGQWSATDLDNSAQRTLQAEFYPDSANGATASSASRFLGGAEDVSALANTQTYKIGGSVGVGASWTVRLHGLRAVEHVVVTPGAPF